MLWIGLHYENEHHSVHTFTMGLFDVLLFYYGSKSLDQDPRWKSQRSNVTCQGECDPKDPGAHDRHTIA
jgi:hypothetical protein